MSEAPTFTRVGPAYRYEPTGKGVTFLADQVKWKDGDLFALVEVRASRSGLPTFLTRHRVNLTGGRGKVDLSRQLAQRAEKDESGHPAVREDEWLALMESLAVRVADAEQQGDPLLWVGLEEPPDGSPYVVERLVERFGINVLFGPGDQGKSWIGRYLTICVQLGIQTFGNLHTRQLETLWVDYETDRDTDARRVRAILKGLDQPYSAFRRWEPKDTLLRQVTPLSRILEAEKVGLYGVDSAGHAAGSPGEHGGWEDAGLNLGKSLKQLLPATPLVLDHVTAEASGFKLAGRASGAIRKFNDARRMWEVRKSQEQENAWMMTGLYQAKGNNSIKWAPIGVRIEFESDVWGRATCVRFVRDDQALRTDPEHSQRGSLRERILEALEHEMTVHQVAKAIGAPADQVAARLRELGRDGKTRQVDSSKGGRGQVVKWVRTEPDNPTALKETTCQSGLGEYVNDSPNPTTQQEENPTSRVLAGAVPAGPRSGATERRNGTYHAAEPVYEWAGDLPDDDGEVL